MNELVAGIGLVSIVLLVSSLGSGLVARAPLSFPMLFLGLGLALGYTGVLTIDTHNRLLELVGVVTLALVLFSDAVKVRIDELRREWFVPLLTLGPGALLTIGGIALTAAFVVGLAPLPALLVGAMLASVDPVVLRDVLRDDRIPRPVRRALSIEAGMNDIVVLPIVLILIAVMTASLSSVTDWMGLGLRLFVVSPVVGIAIGGIGAKLISAADRKWSIRAEYQALYGIGLVLAAFAAGQALQGDGFLAAFFAGLAITIFDIDLCQCFLDYGETTAEMMMLLAFVLFGVVLAQVVPQIEVASAIVLAVIALVVVRPVALTLVLAKARMSWPARLVIGWFGPRGLNSLLLAMLAVQAGLPEADRLMGIVGVVVILSVAVHGATTLPLAHWYGRRVEAETLDEERESTFGGLFDDVPENPNLITPIQLHEAMQGPNPPIVLDVRSRGSYESEKGQIPGSIRVKPDRVEEWFTDDMKSRMVVSYCSCPDEATSSRVSQKLQARGVDARALVGGYPAWEAEYPVEPKAELLQIATSRS